jgi:hypothetical protein
MDKSKMAKEGTVIHYDGRKGGLGHDQMSRRVEQACSEWCCCDKCCNDGKKSLDDTLNPPEPDKNGLICC